MFKKYKHLILGFLLGVTVSASIPAIAAVEELICYKADYKITIMGTEYSDEELPIINYQGNTYAPFKKILEKAGLNVTWNAELRQAEVTSNPSELSPATNDIEGNNMSATTLDLNIWVPVREFAEKYHDTEAGSKFSKILLDNMKLFHETDGIVVIQTSVGNITFCVNSNRTYAKISDLKAVGLLN